VNFELTDEQQALVGALQAILRDHAELPQSARLQYHFHDQKLQHALLENGFLEAGRHLGALEAALIVLETARLPATVEVGASVLVAPKVLADEPVVGPVALLCAGRLAKAHRNLSIARTALVDMGEDAAILNVDPDDVEVVESVLAYPFARFKKVPDLRSARRMAGTGPVLRQWWRVALAAEFSGAAQSAVAFAVDYVKQRKVFGHAVGAFQSVQHRLVQCHMVAMGAQYLTLRAAWSGEPAHADLAACYAQQHVKKLVVDLHQMNGAMGITTENLLHFWTYRLRALQAEAGGAVESAVDIAAERWGRRVEDSRVKV
jgi:acyl-CoA dehydrogenase-like protein